MAEGKRRARPREGTGPWPRGMVLAGALALCWALASCGGSAVEAPEGEGSQAPGSVPTTTAPLEEEPAPSDDTTGGVAPTDPVDIVEHLRAKTMRMWEVYNTHDVDALEPFYEENYWKEQEGEIRSNMQSFRLFRARITAEETSPPTEIAPGKWELKHTGRFRMGSVHMVFIYEQFGGRWLLTYAESE